MLTCVCIAIFALAARTVQVQVLDGGALARAAEAQQRVTVPLWAPRGPILDRTGQFLALSYQAVTVGVWPGRIPDRRAFAQALSRYTSVTPAVIEQRMGGSAQFVFAARRLEPSTWTRIKNDRTLGPLVTSRAIEPQQEPRRIYPKGGLAAQVVGVDGAGLSGVELTRNKELSAQDGLASVSKVNDRPTGDAHWARVLHVREPVPGSQVQLTLDTRIQLLVQKAIEKTRRDWHAKAVTAVVLDTRTGGILAMAAAPGVPPAGYRAGNPDEWRLRAITDLYEPGSTFKLLTFMAALQEGVITPESSFDVPYTYRKYDRVIRDAHYRSGVQRWTAREILAHSSNVGTITIADRRLGETQLRKWIHLTGFGMRTGVDLPGEAPGQVLADDHWYGTAILNVPIGEGIAVTPLQMAALFGSVANGGKWIQPHVTAAIGGKAVTNWKKRQLVSPHVASELRSMLTDVVDKGTGVQARITGYSVAGKTGTTPKYDAKHGTYCNPYKGKCQYQTSFVGFAPAKNPRFLALVMVDEPHDKNGDASLLEGGIVAAPAFKRIAQGVLQVLRVPADRPREFNN
jgi:cell division protein FtsI (penicillin-binding protein 3)/stage V sporulation protein D (sporulation-specific penicillin-binding protein)